MALNYTNNPALSAALENAKQHLGMIRDAHSAALAAVKANDSAKARFTLIADLKNATRELSEATQDVCYMEEVIAASKR